MKQRKPLLLLAVMLILSVTNFFRISGHEDISAIQFISIFVIGMLGGLLIRDLIVLFRTRR